MSDIALSIQNVSKLYKLGVISTGTLSHDLNRWYHRVRGLEDPYQKIAEANIQEKHGDSEYVWALKDVSFEVKQGEAIGIIGKNGAGKSTLLKILSRVTSLTKGEIKINGRIASLLEVGTGFHPELTGRENIFLNGAILGMKKQEIRSKLDEIIAFSGVERYVDTPVKRYSSGMRVRLAFAVAAHLEPEILVVDEVLAVGDAEFQKKAIGKMQDVSQNQGRTVLFVSHNMGSIRALCSRGILLKNGQVDFMGDIEETIGYYLQKGHEKGISLAKRTDRYGNRKLIFKGIDFIDQTGKSIESVMTGDYLKIKFSFDLEAGVDFSRMIIGVNLRDDYQNNVISFLSDEMKPQFNQTSTNQCFLEIPKLLLRGGLYSIRLFASYQNTRAENICDSIENAASLHVISSDFWGSGKTIRADRTPVFQANYFN